MQGEARGQGEGAAQVAHVYGLEDQDTETIFYVGVTHRPSERLGDHLHDPAAWPDRKRWRMVLLATFDDRKEAQQVQRELLRQFPCLDNRVGNPSMKPDFQKRQYVKRVDFEG